MGSTSNCQKFPEESEEDRISNLPINVVGHILSLVPTKDAVQTSILSTKWKQFWKTITSLYFNDGLLFYHQQGISNLGSPLIQSAKFTSFVNRVLLLCTHSRLHRFRLDCGQRYGAALINAWVCAALSRDVREIVLWVSDNGPGLLPPDIFTSRTLEVLKLNICFVLEIPVKLCLEKLKILHLHSIRFRDDESVKRLVHSCTMLEDLGITECGMAEIRVLDISAPMLKILVIDCSYWNGNFTAEWDYNVVLDTPRLEYLEYDDFERESYSLKSLGCLLKADIVIRRRNNGSAIHLIQGLTSVQSLCLSHKSLKALATSLDVFPMFSNLTHLTLGLNKDLGWKFLPNLLTHTPKLETLVIEGHVRYDDAEAEEEEVVVFPVEWYRIPTSPSCFSFPLKEIAVRNFEGKEMEMKMVKYFLERAKVLKRMTLKMLSLMPKEEELVISSKLQKLPKSSATCQVVLIGYEG